jgi:hypothetical protein
VSKRKVDSPRKNAFIFALCPHSMGRTIAFYNKVSGPHFGNKINEQDRENDKIQSGGGRSSSSSSSIIVIVVVAVPVA